MLFSFDVTLLSEQWDDDNWSVDELPTNEDFQNAFDRNYFGSGESDLQTDESTFVSRGGSSFIGLKIEDDGQIEIDSAGYVLESLDKGADGYWAAVVRSSAEVQLSVEAINEREARDLVTSIAKDVFLVRELAVEKVVLKLRS